MKINICAFTGHRPTRFKFGYDEEHPDCIKLKQILLQQIFALIDNGFTTFLTGMALGTDQYAAEIVLGLKVQFTQIKLYCILPCETQANKWSVEQRDRYFNILEQADEVIYVSHQYTDTCIHERNRYMVDHANIILAVYDGKPKSGTAHCVNYARKKGRGIISINPDTFTVTPLLVVVK